MGEHIKIKLKDLNLWTDNPRITSEKERIENELEVIELIDFIEGREKMANLANDIAENGLNPNKQPTVVYNKKKNNYDLYDGNRRIAAMKSMVLGLEYTIEIKNKHNISLDTEILVYNTDRKEALELMERDHSGEQKGRGQISWDSFRRDLARNQLSKETMYPKAFQVAQTCNLKLNDFNEIPYTDMDTIFKSQQIKNIFNIDESDYSNKSRMKLVLQVLESCKPEPYSRFLPKIKSDIKKYEEFNTKVQIELQKRTGKSELLLIKSIFYEHDTVPENLIKNISFDGNKVDPSECQIKYTKLSTSKQFQAFSTESSGKWVIEVSYSGKTISKDIEVKPIKTPEIILNDGTRYKPRQTYSFVEFIIEAKDSYEKNCINEVELILYDSNGNKMESIVDKIKREVAFEKEGVYTVRATYVDLNSGKQTSAESHVKVHWGPINIKDINDSKDGYFDIRILKDDVSFNPTIDNLIVQLNKLYSSKYDYLEVIAASLRSVVESLADLVEEKDSDFIKTKHLNENIKNLYSHMIKNNRNKFFEYISKSESKAKYQTIENYYKIITIDRMESLASMLNLGAHKSSGYITSSILKDNQLIMSHLIEFVYFYLEWKNTSQ